MQVWTYIFLFVRLTYVIVVLGGQKISGADIRDQNGISLMQICWQDWAHTGLVLATQAIANVVKSSFGPSGLDKMMVDDIGVRYPAETH